VAGVLEARASGAAVTYEAKVLVLATPTGRALNVLTVVPGQRAAAYDAVVRIHGGIAITRGGAAAGGRPGPNPCWEFAGHPNGWSTARLRGARALLPRGWRSQEATDPNTQQRYLTLGHAGTGSQVLVLLRSDPTPEAGWRAVGASLATYGLGQSDWGTVAGQRAICARGSATDSAGNRLTTDAVLLHRGTTTLVGVGVTVGDPTTMRAVLGSLRLP
jgi:hypothetical protein